MSKVGKILIIVLSVIVVGGGIVGGLLYAKIYANPYNRLEVAMFKSAFAKQEDVTARLKYTLVPEKYEEFTGMPLYDEEKAMMEYANVLLQKAIFEINYKQDLNEKNPIDSQFQYTMNVLYDNEKLLDLIVGLNEEEFEILMPSLISKTFFVTKADIFEEMDFDYEDFDFEKYMAIIKDNNKLLKKVDMDVYRDIFKEAYEDKITKGDTVEVELANGKTVKCKEYILEMKYDEIIDVMKDIKDALEEDEVVREYMRVTGLALLEELLESKDYEAFNIEEDDLEEAISYLEDEDDFEDAYEELMVAFDDMIYEMESVVEEVPVDVDYKVTYALDRKNDMRAMQMAMDMGFMKADYDIVVNSINEKVEFDKYEDNERIDIMGLIDEDEEKLMELFEDVIVDAGDKVVANKALDSLLNDMKDNSNMLPEYYQEQFKMGIEEFQKNKETFIQMFVDEAINSMMYPYGF